MAPTSTSLEAFFSSRADKPLVGRLALDAIPQHVAVIMDGNGRWAAQRGMPRSLGHKAGVHAVKETIAASLELGVQYLTLYSFSSENWRRPADEVKNLMNLFVDVIDRELPRLCDHDVRVKVIGSFDGVPEKTQAAFARAETGTQHCTTMTLIVALNYGGRLEIVEAAAELAKKCCEGALSPEMIDEPALAGHLYTADIPDPDLLIRTSGEKRLSNFLLWQVAYTEFWVTPVLWPDFRRGDLLKAIIDYQGRSRRYGGSE